MLIGEYEGKLTDKNRIAIPAKIRASLEEGLILSRGYEGCLILLDEKRWKELITIVSSKPLLNLTIRDTKRFLLGGAHELELDNQGRFVLPTSLKTYADLKQDLVFIGIMDWVEIWDKTRWEIKLDQLSRSATDIADRLVAEYGNKT